MATLTNPKTGVTITVPDDVEESYTSRGWVAPGTLTPAEPVEEAMNVLQACDDEVVAVAPDRAVRGGTGARRREKPRYSASASSAVSGDGSLRSPASMSPRSQANS